MIFWDFPTRTENRWKTLLSLNREKEVSRQRDLVSLSFFQVLLNFHVRLLNLFFIIFMLIFTIVFRSHFFTLNSHDFSESLFRGNSQIFTQNVLTQFMLARTLLSPCY